MIKHGSQRNYRLEEIRSKEMRMVTQTGETVLVTGSSGDTSVSDYYCTDCGWQEVRGVLAGIFGCPSCGRDWESSR